jgi:hypothetical protein
VALGFLALASLAVVSAFVFSSRLDTKREGQHRAALIAMDSMEEARVLLSQDIYRDVTIPKVEHIEIKHLYLERSQRWVGVDLGLPDNPLKEVRIEVTWGSQDKPETYVLEERFNKPSQ